MPAKSADYHAKLAELFGGEIVQSINHADNLIVRIDQPKGVINNCNVYAVSDCGEVVWRVEENGIPGTQGIAGTPRNSGQFRGHNTKF